MVDKSNEYGYIGASPTQSSSANTGIFEANDVVDLLNTGQYKLQLVNVDYLVIAGGGAGGQTSGTNNSRGAGGGGAGGYRTSYGTGNISGANSAVETTLVLNKGQEYALEVGAGSPVKYVNGSASNFATVSTVGGGFGGLNSNKGNGGSGGGSGHSGSGGTGTANEGRNGGGGYNSGVGNGTFAGGAGGGGSAGSTGVSGTPATGGGGGGGHNGGPGLGGSGTVILRYPNSSTISLGTGVTSTAGEQTDGADKYIELIGSGNVSIG